jgi:hypothetical protein
MFKALDSIPTKQTNQQKTALKSLDSCWWLIPVILVPQETEIRRITV